MPILSGEALTIAALVNNQDVTAGRQYGLTASHFKGYQAEYNWLLSYVETYGYEPSKDAFRAAFPDFVWSDHEDIRSAIDMVFKSAAKRGITEAMTEAMEKMRYGQVHEAYQTLVAAEPLRTSAKPRAILTDMEFLDSWDEEQVVIHTPYPSVNRVTGGMKPGNLWYLAARPGQGKSAHLVNIVKQAVLDGNRCKFYSLEMSEAEVRGRFHAAMATHYGYEGITLTGIRDRRVDRHLYKTFMGELQEKMEDAGGCLEIHTPKEGMVTPGAVAASASEYHLNVIDYIGLMRTDAGGRTQDWQNTASISNDLKLTGLAAETVMLVAAQINRDGETGKEPPKLHNLAGSDSLGQDADVLITMRAMPHDVATALSVEKNRHGPGVSFYTKFDPDWGRFGEITRDQAEDLALAAEDM